jgi:hypothetical protein
VHRLEGSLGDLDNSRLATAAPVEDTCFAPAYAAVAILLIEVDSGGVHFHRLAHYSGVGAGVHGPVQARQQRFLILKSRCLKLP